MVISVMVRHINDTLANRYFHGLKCTTDIDECLEETDLCDQVCVNTAGSYICQCNLRFRLNSDVLTCRGK